MKKNKNIILNGLIDLAQPRLGTKVVYRTDDFFAAAKRIIDPSPPVFKEGVFDKNGKWMDGWETRRKRKSGHDYLILKLGKPGRIHKVDIDTSHFNGNQPSQVSLRCLFI
jgi:allantoicase